MERFDLKFVLHTIQENMRNGTLNTQDKIIGNLFKRYYYSNQSKTTSIGQPLASQIFKGEKLLVSNATYYKKHRDELLQDVENYLLPALFDKGNVAQIIYNVIENDNSLSRNMVLEFKNLLPGSDRDTYAIFFEKVIYEAISRPSEKQDEKELNADSPEDRCPIPRPCRYFRGRDTELNQIWDRLGRSGSLVLTSCQSIGKSEVCQSICTTIQHFISPYQISALHSGTVLKTVHHRNDTHNAITGAKQ